MYIKTPENETDIKSVSVLYLKHIIMYLRLNTCNNVFAKLLYIVATYYINKRQKIVFLTKNT